MTDKQKEIMRIIERHQMPLQDRFDIWHDVVRSEKWMPLVVDLEAYFQEKQRLTGVKDMHGNEIRFGDKVRFADKWEWYRTKYGPKMFFADKEEKMKIMDEFEKEPYEERIVEGIQDYEWLLSSEVQMYWEIIEQSNHPDGK